MWKEFSPACTCPEPRDPKFSLVTFARVIQASQSCCLCLCWLFSCSSTFMQAQMSSVDWRYQLSSLSSLAEAWGYGTGLGRGPAKNFGEVRCKLKAGCKLERSGRGRLFNTYMLLLRLYCKLQAHPIMANVTGLRLLWVGHQARLCCVGGGLAFSKILLSKRCTASGMITWLLIFYECCLLSPSISCGVTAARLPI